MEYGPSVYDASVCVSVSHPKLAHIVKMKNQDLAKLPHRGCQANKIKTLCENDNSLAHKLPPPPFRKTAGQTAQNLPNVIIN